MAYALGARSRAELAGVHPKLAAVAERAIAISVQDFGVHDGLRSEAEQREYVRRGVSKTMDSKHRPQADGFGHAMDLVPFINGKLRWEWPPIYKVAAAVLMAAREQGVRLRWGGVWDRPFDALAPKNAHLDTVAANLEAEVQLYVARRLKAGKRAFIDGPHYELAEVGV